MVPQLLQRSAMDLNMLIGAALFVDGREVEHSLEQTVSVNIHSKGQVNIKEHWVGQKKKQFPDIP